MTSAARLRLVAGKGGVGKSTVAAALAQKAADEGRSVLAVDATGNGALAQKLNQSGLGSDPKPTRGQVSALTLSTVDALDHYLKLYLRLPAGFGLVAGPSGVGPISRIFEYVATAAPGVREILVIGKIGWEARDGGWDEVIVDCPATGHVVELLRAPQSIAELVPVGPLADQAAWLTDLLAAPSTSVDVVTTTDELAVSETLDLLARLDTETDTRVDRLIVNRVPPTVGEAGLSEAASLMREGHSLGPLALMAGANSERSARQLARLERSERVASFESSSRIRIADSAVDPLAAARAGLDSTSVGSAPPTGTSASEDLKQASEAVDGEFATASGDLATASGDLAAMDRLLEERKVIVVAGPGGVGKTTTAAALGVRAAREHGRRVTVVTVDPARRLADALGVARVTEERVLVPVGGAADGAKGRLWVVMVDMATSWDRLVRRCAPDQDLAERLIANGLYRSLTRRFVQSHDYVALDQILALEDDGRSDLLIVDTPPAEHALDLIDAPSRLLEFFDGRLLRLLAAGTGGVGALVARPFRAVAEQLLGPRFLNDISDFFTLFAELRPALAERVAELEQRLSEPTTAYLAVTTSEPDVAAGCEQLLDALAERERGASVVVVNRLPPALSLADDGAELLLDETVEQVLGGGDAPRAVPRDASLAAAVAGLAALARRARLPDRSVPRVAVGMQLRDPVTVDDLDRLLIGEGPPPADPH